MSGESEVPVDIRFAAPVLYWRGPPPYHFLAIPAEHVGEVRYAARLASYGWGVVPVAATIGDVDFHTSLFPRDGGYLLPLKAVVRRDAAIEPEDVVQVRMRVRGRPT